MLATIEHTAIYSIDVERRTGVLYWLIKVPKENFPGDDEKQVEFKKKIDPIKISLQNDVLSFLNQNKMQMMMRSFDGSGHFNQNVLTGKAAISTFMKKITDLSGKPLQNRIIYALTNNDGQLVLDFRNFNHFNHAILEDCQIFIQRKRVN